MAEYLSPGIFIEEVNVSGQQVDAVGTSTMAIVGWTRRGAVDTARLVTSSDDFFRKFGEYTNDSRVPISVQAFFANGGTRAYVVRVVPTDAAAGEACINESVLAENPTFAPAEDPDDVGPHLATLSLAPVAADTMTIDWAESIQASDTFFFNSLPLDTETITLDSRTYTFNTVLGGADSILIGGTISDTIDNLVAAINDGVGGAGEGSLYGVGTVAHATSGALNLDTAGAPYTPVADTMLAYYQAGGTAGNGVVVSETIADALSVWSTGAPGAYAGGTDADAKTATLSSGTTVGGTDAARISAASIDYDTGDLSITFAAKIIGTNNGPDADSITVDYAYCLWSLDADNVGTWSDRMTLRVTGNENYFTSGDQSVSGAGTYSKFDVTVLLTSTVTGEDEVKETYEEVVFDDVDDPLYFPDVLNQNSDFITVTDTGSLDVPAALKGTAVSAEVLGTGDAIPTINFTGTLASFPIVKTSLVITYTPVAGGTRTLVADVNGNITGTGLDITKTNTVNRTTGAFELNFSGGADAPQNATNITADYIASPSVTSIDYTFSGGSDGTLSGGTFDRTVFTSPVLQASRRGMYALDRIDEVMQLVIPDFAGDTTVMGDQLDYAEGRLDIFSILTTPQNYDAEEAKDFKTITFTRKSKFAAMYWPWVKVTDPLNSARTLTVPPLAWVAGIYARTDQTRNVGKAPGGTVDGALRFLTGLERDPDKGERDTVYPVRINPLINTTQTGLAVWGVRTMSATNDVLRYVNAVRLFQFVEKSIFNSTFGFVFESITSNLYSQIKATVDAFLLNLYTTGHFAGSSPDQAYFVIVDETNNPPEVVNQGQVIVDIGIAPNRPGEFIRFRFSQKTLTA